MQILCTTSSSQIKIRSLLYSHDDFDMMMIAMMNIYNHYSLVMRNLDRRSGYGQGRGISPNSYAYKPNPNISVHS